MNSMSGSMGPGSMGQGLPSGYQQATGRNQRQFNRLYGFDPSQSTRHGKLRGEMRPHGFEFGQVQQYTPAQLQQHASLFQHVQPGSYLDRLAGGDEETFQQIEKPQLRQFQELLGGIGSRFSGMGMGARKSSGFQNYTTSAAQNFAEQLGSQRQQLQRQALQELMGYSHELLGQKPYERFLAEKKQKVKKGPIVASMLGSAIGGLVGSYGGPMGTQAGIQAGGQLGQGLGQLFS